LLTKFVFNTTQPDALSFMKTPENREPLFAQWELGKEGTRAWALSV